MVDASRTDRNLEVRPSANFEQQSSLEDIKKEVKEEASKVMEEKVKEEITQKAAVVGWWK